MKVIVTEQQINNLLGNLGSAKLNIDPSIIKFGRFLQTPKQEPDTSSNDVEQKISTEPLDKSLIPDGDVPLHPLGKKIKLNPKNLFGWRFHPVYKKNMFHYGIDMGTPSGSPIYSPLDGKVIASRDTTPNSCGGFIMIKHDKYMTKYCHVSRMIVREGQMVKKGDIVGYTGGGKTDPHPGTSTSPHLHYAITDFNNKHLDPVQVQPNLV